MMKPFDSLIPYDEARRIVESKIEPITRVETVAIDDAPGRVLAEAVIARLSVPSFDRAAMDGYAVKFRDTIGSSRQNPKILRVTGELPAGTTHGTELKAGECLQVATGAILPPGADAVVMVEDVEADNGRISVFKPASAGAYISREGEDITDGSTVLEKDAVLDAGKIGVLASQGMTKVSVFAKPEVAILSSGEEVTEPGKKLNPGNIFDVNSHTIASIVKLNGGVPLIAGVVRDNPGEIRAKIGEALGSDLVVISGGSSVGERDLLVNALTGWGKILFHGVQVKPGKPTLFAMVGGKLLFGMPGPPATCLIHSYLFVAPTIRKIAHLRPKRGRTAVAKLERRVAGMTGKRQFLTVKIEGDMAVPVFKKTSAITCITGSDGFIEIPENVELLEKGQIVTVTLF